MDNLFSFLSSAKDTLLVFNTNAISHIVYTLTENYAFALIAGGTLGTVFLYLKEEIDEAVREEQGIL